MLLKIFNIFYENYLRITNANRYMDFKLNDFKKNGAKIGKEVKIYTRRLAPEPYLVEIGDNTTISYEVNLITHDNAITNFCDKTDLLGKIKIGKNCFVGARVTILPGCTIGDNCIIGAGSVVIKSVASNSVVAGNPAKVISNIDTYVKKNYSKAIDLSQYKTKAEKEEYIKTLSADYFLRK